jgi:hypothetical protein
MPLYNPSVSSLGIYATQSFFVSTNQDVTNSSTLTDSTDLQATLLAGATYDFVTNELIGASAYATSGAKSILTYTGSATFAGCRLRNGFSGTEPINNTPSWGGSSDTVNGQASEPSKSLIVNRIGRIITTTSGILKVQFAQTTAVAAQYARLIVGSYMQLQRVS